MALLETGTVCVQKKGRNAGKRVVVLELQKSRAVVEGLDRKRRKCNVTHLHPTSQKIPINKNASKEDVHQALKSMEWKK